MIITIEIDLTDEEVLDYINRSHIKEYYDDDPNISNTDTFLKGVIDEQKNYLTGGSLNFKILKSQVKDKMCSDLKSILFDINSYKRDVTIDKILK